MAVGIGKTGRGADVGGILRSLEDILGRGGTSSGLGERFGGCSSCEFPCAPIKEKQEMFFFIIWVSITIR